MGTFVEGDIGRDLLFSCGFTPLNENDQVKITIKFGEEIFTKDAEVLSTVSGRCRVSLTNLEILVEGKREYQSTVYFADGKVFTNPSVGNFMVTSKMSGIEKNPNIVDGGSFDSPDDQVDYTFDGGEF
jgi:hypothetical protein